LVAVAAKDVDELCRVGHQPGPAIGFGHFAGIALVEADTPGEDGARGFDAGGQPHAVGGVRDLGRGRHNHCRIGMHAAPVEGIGECRDLEQRQLGCGKNDDVELVARRRISREEDGNKAVAGVLYNAASVAADLWIHQFAKMRLEPFVRAFLRARLSQSGVDVPGTTRVQPGMKRQTL
jgi:hypothetical protein